MFRLGYAVSMQEETVRTAPVLHILAEEPFTLGTITRDVGDAYCKPGSHFYDLWDEGIGPPPASAVCASPQEEPMYPECAPQSGPSQRVVTRAASGRYSVCPRGPAYKSVESTLPLQVN